MLSAALTGPIVSAVTNDAISSGVIGFWIVLSSLFIGLTVVTLVNTWRTSYGENMTRKLAREVNLALPDELWPEVRHHLMWRLRGSLIGGALGFLGLVLIVRPWEPRAAAGTEVSLIGLSVVFFGNQLGAAVGGMLARRRSVGSIRTARLQPITHRELVAPLWRRLAVVAAVAGLASAIAFTAAATVLPRVESGFFADVPLLFVAAVCTALLAAAMPRIAQRFAASRALAGDDYALAWSDALASRTVRDLSIGVIWAGFATVATAFASVGRLLPADRQLAVFQFQSVATVLMVLVVIAVLLIVLVTSPDRHLQRTVWPELALDTVLDNRDAQ